MKQERPFQFRLDYQSGVPVYRQMIDQVYAGIASGALAAGDQLPTVRQAAVDLSINPNTVLRAYRELEIRNTLTTHQGTGTFITGGAPERDDADQQRRLAQLVAEFLARAGQEGFSLKQLREQLNRFATENKEKRS